MRDIATLKERVDFAERHLKATETARNRESEALMDMWRKIRERFSHQEDEIARYRAEVETLTEGNGALSRMVDDLIAIIDGNIERGRDETVPKVAALAEDLLASEPTAEDFSRFADDAPDRAPDIVSAASRDAASWDDVERDPEPADRASDDAPSAAAAPEDDDGADRAASEESLSPGIRSLIQRVESSVGETGGVSSEAGDDGEAEDDDLARELREIEMLRTELSGLRDRISAGDA
jgi:hypothetical protein